MAKREETVSEAVQRQIESVEETIGPKGTSDADLEGLARDVTRVVKPTNGNTRNTIVTLLRLLTPFLVASPDPRIKAIGLALRAGIVALEVKKRIRRE